jgi:hypothetical protein
MSPNPWNAADPGQMALLDQQIAASRTTLREHVARIAEVLESDSDPSHVIVRLTPTLLGWSPETIAGGYAVALVELAEAKRKGEWQ